MKQPDVVRCKRHELDRDNTCYTLHEVCGLRVEVHVVLPLLQRAAVMIDTNRSSALC